MFLINNETKDLYINVFNEDDGSITVEFEDLELTSNSDTLENAVSKLADSLIIFINEYKNNLEVYFNLNNRRKYYDCVLNILSYGSRENLINSFKYNYLPNKESSKANMFVRDGKIIARPKKCCKKAKTATYYLKPSTIEKINESSEKLNMEKSEFVEKLLNIAFLSIEIFGDDNL